MPESVALAPRLTVAERDARFQACVAARTAPRPSGGSLLLGDDGRWRNDDGYLVCGAKKRNGDPCSQTGLGPAGRCRMHSGFAPSGPLAPVHRKGIYSRAMPAPLARMYERLRQDQGLTSLRDDLAVITARIDQVLSGATATAADGLAPALGEFERALNYRDGAGRPDPIRVQTAFETLKAAVAAVKDESSTWRAVVDLQRHKARLARTEHLRVAAQATMVDAASAWALVYGLIDLVRTHVTDPAARRALHDGVVRLVGRGATPGAE